MDKKSYSIFQVKDGEELLSVRFEPLERLKATGNTVDSKNYHHAYTGIMEADETLSDLYEKFNIDHPEDFLGRSLSVSDVVVISQNGKSTAHYCDSFGWAEVPEFLDGPTPEHLKRTDTINVLLVKPGEHAKEAEIANSLKSLQQIVGGYIETFTPNDDPIVYIMNEEGKILDLEDNRGLHNKQGVLMDIIQGTFVVCGAEDGEFVSLSPELMAKYKERFFEPGIKTVISEVKKPIAEQMKEGAEQAAKYNAARTVPEKKTDKDRS